jgi:uncharacterized membrane protein YhaH (DUF805 family)
MNMQQAVKNVLSQYATFSGRARRSEYWFWTLTVVILSIIGAILDAITGGYIFQVVIALATLIPSIAVAARRLHDTGRSGWWQLLGLIPLVGTIILIVWYATDSEPNKAYGPNPKAEAPGSYGQMQAPPPQ